MRMELEFKDIQFIKTLLQEREEIYRKQIVESYVDDSTKLEHINLLEQKQNRIKKILDKLRQY